MENQFTALKRDKKERAAKNELKRLRNIARNSKNGRKIMFICGLTLSDL